MPSKTKLPPEIVSLIYHIELNQAGWWEEAVKKFILASLLILDKPATEGEIINFLRSEFNVRPPKEKISEQLDALSGWILIPIESGKRYKLSEEQCRRMKGEIQSSVEEDRKAGEHFKQVFARNCNGVDPDSAWNSFNENLLLPFIKEAGASTYLNFTEQQTVGTESIEKFLARFSEEARPGLQKSIREFLNLSNESVRNYILRYLNAFFFIEASGISEENLNKIDSALQAKPGLTIFLDTNFIISILGLRDTEANIAADSFLQLIGEVSKRINIKLYILNTTVDETKAALSLISEGLGQLRLQPNLAEAVLDVDFGNFVNKLAVESQKAGSAISPKAYLAPYQSNLMTILRGKGIELYNKNLKEFEESEEVAKDVNAVMRREEKTSHPKKTAQWFHDIVLWHFVRSLRPSVIESPLEAKDWIVTVDRKFLNFDVRKNGGRKDFYPICLFPISFIRLLEFWIPRSQQLEEALFRNVRLPMLFPSFDPRTENAALRILETLSRYENAKDLPKETVTALLMNTALQQKLFEEKDEEKRIEYVREALVDEHAKVARRLGEERQKRRDAEVEIDASQSEVAHQKSLAEKERLQRESVERDLYGQLEGIKKTLGERELAEAQRVLALSFYKKAVMIPILLGIVIVIAIAFSLHFCGATPVLDFAGLVIFIPILMKIKKDGGTNEAISTKKWFTAFNRLYGWGLGFFSLVGVAVLGEAIKAVLKYFLPSIFS